MECAKCRLVHLTAKHLGPRLQRTGYLGSHACTMSSALAGQSHYVFTPDDTADSAVLDPVGGYLVDSVEFDSEPTRGIMRFDQDSYKFIFRAGN
jgi:hypothetical protein